MFEVLAGRAEWNGCLDQANEAIKSYGRNHFAKSVEYLHMAAVYAMHNFLQRYNLPYDNRTTLLALMQETGAKDYLPDLLYSDFLYIAIMGDIVARKKRSVTADEAYECLRRLDEFVSWLLQAE